MVVTKDKWIIVEIAPNINEAERRLNQYRKINDIMHFNAEYKVEGRDYLPGYNILYREKQ